MEPFFITSTSITPAIKFSPENGFLAIKGRSSPENSLRFYSRLLETISRANLQRLNVKICLEYFNTSSSKCLFNLLRIIKFRRDSGVPIHVKWYYESFDDDMLEVGEDYSEALDLPFVFVEYDSTIK